MNALLLQVLVPLHVLAARVGPKPKDVTAGWLGFAVFLALALAVVLLWLSLRRQLKKVDFVEEPAPPGSRPRRPGRVTIPTSEELARREQEEAEHGPDSGATSTNGTSGAARPGDGR